MTKDIVRCTYPACPEGSCCAKRHLTENESIAKRATEIAEELRKALPLNTDFGPGWQERYLSRQNERHEKALEMARAEAEQQLPPGELTEDEWRAAAAEDRAARAAIAGSSPAHQVVAADAWQPIETAPKDGQNIILSNGVDVAQGYWVELPPYIGERRDMGGRYIDQDENDGYTGWLDCDGGMQPDPTHWMPLPPAAVHQAAPLAEPTQPDGEKL